MTNTYRIKTNKVFNYAIRRTLSRVWFLFLGPFVPGLLIVFSGTDIPDEKLLYTFLVPLGTLIPILIISLIITKEHLKTYRYVFTEKTVELRLDDKELNTLMKIIIFIISSRARRFSHKEERALSFKNIQSIEITSKDITITAMDNSLLTNNGKLTIPKEVENFDDIKSLFKKLKSV